jgi:hypothetical protein
MSFISSIFTNVIKDLVIDKFLNKNNKSFIKSEKTLNKNNLRHPTSETIFYTLQFDVGQFLLYLFPNTFFNKNEAEDFYIDFCKNAKKYNEAEIFYTQTTWYDGIVKCDLLSNMKIYWNENKKTMSYGFNFKLFTPYNIKNEDLKKEIEKIYNENIEHLQKIHFLPNESNLEFYISLSDSIWITPSGIEWANWNTWGFNDKKFLGFPINSFLKLLRINKVYDLNKAEKKELLNKFKKWHKKRPYKFKLNFDENSIQLDNEFIRVNLDTKYDYAEDLDDFLYGYKVKNVDLF